jgi:hypothetical protein
MQLRSGKKAIPITNFGVLKIYIDEVKDLEDQNQKVESVLKLYKFLYQKKDFFVKPEHKKFVNSILEKSQELKISLNKMVFLENKTKKMIYECYFYIDMVMDLYGKSAL